MLFELLLLIFVGDSLPLFIVLDRPRLGPFVETIGGVFVFVNSSNFLIAKLTGKFPFFNYVFLIYFYK